MEHWNGTRWQYVPVPRGVALADPPLAPFPPVTASSGHDAWIFPAVFQLWGGCNCIYQYALRWDGHRWHRSSFPAKLVVATALAFGRRDVWAFGSAPHGPDSSVPYAARYDGRSWHRVTVPAEPLAVTAASPRDLWAGLRGEVWLTGLCTSGNVPRVRLR